MARNTRSGLRSAAPVDGRDAVFDGFLAELNWPPELLDKDWMKKEAKRVAEGSHYGFKSPGDLGYVKKAGGEYKAIANRYVKKTAAGPVAPNAPSIHVSVDNVQVVKPKKRRAPADKQVVEHPRIEAAKDIHGYAPPNIIDQYHGQPHDAVLPTAGIAPEDRPKLNKEHREFGRKNHLKETKGLSDPIAQKIRKTRAQAKKAAAPLARNLRGSARLKAQQKTSHQDDVHVEAQRVTPTVSVQNQTPNAAVLTTVTPATAAQSDKLPASAQNETQATEQDGLQHETTAVVEKAEAPKGHGLMQPPPVPSLKRKAPEDLEGNRPVKKAATQTARPQPPAANKTQVETSATKKRKAEADGAPAPAKRPRVNHACDMCREKKTRCDGVNRCGACTKRNSECIFSDGPAPVLNSKIKKEHGSTSARAASTNVPSTNGPSTNVSSTKAPSTKVPSTKAASTKAASTKAPSTKVPSTKVPSTKAASTKAASTKAPSTQAPSTQAPSTKAASTKAAPKKAELSNAASGPLTSASTAQGRVSSNKTLSAKPPSSRQSRACDQCRVKKTKCDGCRPCNACQSRSFTCTYGAAEAFPKVKEESEGSGPSGPFGPPDTSGPAASGPSDRNDQARGTAGSASDSSLGCSTQTDTSKQGQKRKLVEGPGEEPTSSRLVKRVKITLHFPARTAKLRPASGFETLKLSGIPENIQQSIEERLGLKLRDMMIWKLYLSRGQSPEWNIDDLLQEESFHNRPSIKLVIPDVLKGLLVDDWENITKTGHYVELPHKKATVQKILDDYLAVEKPNREAGSTQMDILEETVDGLREYFDKALGRILLYRFERLQYADVSKTWTTEQGPSTTYGAEHLARLLVSLPELIAQTNMDQQSVGRLREELTKFTNWLVKNYPQYWVNDYVAPESSYLEKAKTG